ncbi:MAG: hypothetical protein JO164_04815, partial [Candidatus Eremiobacteraeota bacterium]|nr:hypothetical protein [Candidatus Eremiobacteraeota bacterium]
MLTPAVYDPGLSESVIVHVVVPPLVAHPGDDGVRFAETVVAPEHPVHPPAGAIAAESDCVDAEMYRGLRCDADVFAAAGIVMTIDACDGPPDRAPAGIEDVAPEPPHALKASDAVTRPTRSRTKA